MVILFRTKSKTAALIFDPLGPSKFARKETVVLLHFRLRNPSRGQNKHEYFCGPSSWSPNNDDEHIVTELQIGLAKQFSEFYYFCYLYGLLID